MNFIFKPPYVAKFMNLDSTYILHLHDNDILNYIGTSHFSDSNPTGSPT